MEILHNRRHFSRKFFHLWLRRVRVLVPSVMIPISKCIYQLFLRCSPVFHPDELAEQVYRILFAWCEKPFRARGWNSQYAVHRYGTCLRTTRAYCTVFGNRTDVSSSTADIEARALTLPHGLRSLRTRTGP